MTKTKEEKEGYEQGLKDGMMICMIPFIGLSSYIATGNPLPEQAKELLDISKRMDEYGIDNTKKEKLNKMRVKRNE